MTETKLGYMQMNILNKRDGRFEKPQVTLVSKERNETSQKSAKWRQPVTYETLKMKISIVAGSKGFELEVIEGEGAITTLGDLKIAICEQGGFDPERLKLIHKGKTLSGPDAALLEKMQFKENDKVLVMGRTKAALKDDPGFATLLKYENDHLKKLGTTLEGISTDLTELEKNFLDKVKSQEMVNKLEKRYQLYTETCLGHIDTIDALTIISEDTPAEQATRNREKRKALIGDIQTLVRHADKDIRRLDEYKKKLTGEIVE